jgi:uncharacterized membrane protein YfcA
MKEYKIVALSIIITLIGVWLVFMFYTEQAEILAMFRDFVISLFLIAILLTMLLEPRKDDKK